MNIKFDRKKGTLIAYLSGELDHHSSKGIKEKIDYELMKPVTKSLVIDFKGVSFMDSSGIGIIYGRYNNVRSFGGRMGITSLSDNLIRVIRLSGVDKHVEVFENIDNAVFAFNN